MHYHTPSIKAGPTLNYWQSYQISQYGKWKFIARELIYAATCSWERRYPTTASFTAELGTNAACGKGVCVIGETALQSEIEN